jgi:methyl-accepting chemotaxis protein
VANANVSKLGESSVEIGEVIKVITSIAEQTNLLALNEVSEVTLHSLHDFLVPLESDQVYMCATESAANPSDISA